MVLGLFMFPAAAFAAALSLRLSGAWPWFRVRTTARSAVPRELLFSPFSNPFPRAGVFTGATSP